MNPLPVLLLLVFQLFTIIPGSLSAQRSHPTLNSEAPLPAANRIQVYLPLLKGKRVGLFANPTSLVGNKHLVDTLLALGVHITRVFGPEHGFRGKADAGATVDNYLDAATGIPVISLFGKKRKPDAEDLKEVDVLLFDIQDVGTRFYTYISSLQEFMEAAFENSKPLMILDRPNPNGFYVDGPVLDTAFRSFVGMQPIPIVYGMTMAEYAFMIAGEHWLSPKANEKYAYYQRARNSPDTAFHFQVIKCANYTHKSFYQLPVKPSPNLPDMASVYWYPGTCLFEGTILSEGRGTEHPFAEFGHPSLPDSLFAFTPVSREGANQPKLMNQVCHGWNLSGKPDEVLKKINGHIPISYLLEAYRLFPDKSGFFLPAKNQDPRLNAFNRLAGNSHLMEQIQSGLSEDAIRKSWEKDIQAFKKIRKKYLLYPDFE
ncbi:MAG: DUF1343 domain-containing protein [Bacteroidota bacterium]|nr:DUF1343 domain-containing protein [Bacteroidota bacterium]